MNEADIERFMVQDWVVTGSDGSAGHPRKYGTFPRKIREYALMRGLMTLPEVIVDVIEPPRGDGDAAAPIAGRSRVGSVRGRHPVFDERRSPTARPT